VIAGEDVERLSGRKPSFVDFTRRALRLDGAAGGG